MMLFTGEAAVLEHAGFTAALSRSFKIAGAQSGEVLMASLLLTTLHLCATVLGDVVGRGIIEQVLEFRTPASIWESGITLLSLAGFWLFVPYAATARFFVYLNTRTRSEGWDIQTRFAAIAARDPDALERAA
jgi:hypothetical protein